MIVGGEKPSTCECSLPLCFECGQSVRRARTAKTVTAVASQEKNKLEKEEAEEEHLMQFTELLFLR